MTMQGSFRKPELAADRQGRGRRSADHRACTSRAPFSPLIAQLTDRAGMMVSPEGREGGRRQVRPASRSAPGPTSSSSACSRTASCSRSSPTTGTRPTSTSTASPILPIVGRDGAARQPQVGPARPDRAAARDRHQGRCSADQSLKLATDHRARLPGPHHQRRQRRARRRTRSARTPGAPGARAGDRPRGAQPGRVQRRVTCRATSGSARRTPTTRRNSRCRSATSRRPRRCSRKPA